MRFVPGGYGFPCCLFILNNAAGCGKQQRAACLPLPPYACPSVCGRPGVLVGRDGGFTGALDCMGDTTSLPCLLGRRVPDRLVYCCLCCVALPYAARCSAASVLRWRLRFVPSAASVGVNAYHTTLLPTTNVTSLPSYALPPSLHTTCYTHAHARRPALRAAYPVLLLP
jgi:hypothetical protein